MGYRGSKDLFMMELQFSCNYGIMLQNFFLYYYFHKECCEQLVFKI